MNFKQEQGGYRVTITDTTTTIESLSEGFYTLSVGYRHPLHAFMLGLATAGTQEDIDGIFALAKIYCIASQHDEVVDFAMQLARLDTEFRQGKAKPITLSTDEEDKIALEQVKIIQSYAESNNE